MVRVTVFGVVTCDERGFFGRSNTCVGCFKANLEYSFRRAQHALRGFPSPWDMNRDAEETVWQAVVLRHHFTGRSYSKDLGNEAVF